MYTFAVSFGREKISTEQFQKYSLRAYQEEIKLAKELEKNREQLRKVIDKTLAKKKVKLARMSNNKDF